MPDWSVYDTPESLRKGALFSQIFQDLCGHVDDVIIPTLPEQPEQRTGSQTTQKDI